MNLLLLAVILFAIAAFAHLGHAAWLAISPQVMGGAVERPGNAGAANPQHTPELPLLTVACSGRKVHTAHPFSADMDRHGAGIVMAAALPQSDVISAVPSLTFGRGKRNAPTAQTFSAPTPVTLRRECAWCHGFLGGDPASPQITHGICPACEVEFFQDQQPQTV